MNNNEQNNSMELTYLLKHQQDKNLDVISTILANNAFWKIFPPEDVEVLSWKVLIGLGHVVTLRFAVSRLREVNLAIERGAWGAFDTEAYSTYDYLQVWQEKAEK
ncbi:hypothetical protein [Pedobacter cryoconitis]|uniref:Uncharacterized protein n=1 Tax=Pedobacter cryoconitis TaxID=188932 RepID=A0A7X0J556_9SPHI|nr:hypothetical protein [Pedobacter cryoconitis]MBB6499826.1 hypothetical protein [Pedobacter cryoconitis]